MSEQNLQSSIHPQYEQHNKNQHYENKDYGKGLSIFSYIFLAVTVVVALVLVIAFEYPEIF